MVWFNAQPLVLGRTYLIKHDVRMVARQGHDDRFPRQHEDARARTGARPEDERYRRGATSNPPSRSSSIRTTATAPPAASSSIDPLSNATVGAAMIRGAAASQEDELALWNAPVSAEERYQRHGHEPALILVEGKPGLAPVLERALFARDFEVALVSEEGAPAGSFAELAKFSLSAGLILIYETAALSTEERGALSAVAPDRIIDLRAMELPSDHRAAAALVLDQVQLLCRPLGPSSSGE